MSLRDIQTEKLNLINWISSLNDEDVIQKLKSFHNSNIEIPEWHKKILDERKDNYAKNPDSYKDISELRKNIKL